MLALVGHLSAVDKASLFDALERAATHVGLALFVVHVDARPPTVLYGSALLAELVGRPLSELIGRPPWELVAPAQQDQVRDIIASRGPGAPPITLEFEIERPDGSRRAIEVGVARITTTGAELAVCYFRDTTDEHAAVAAMRRSDARFRSLIAHAPDGVVILQHGHIVLANPVAVRMFGVPDFESVRGRPLADFLPPEEAARARDRIAQLLAGVPIEPSEYRLRHGLVVEVHACLYDHNDMPAILAFVRDATERRRMQDQLFRTDRLAALGTMAATVAHEINNPLAYLQLNLQRLERAAAAEPDPERAAVLRAHVANALHGVERIARIVRDLGSYSRDRSDDEPDAAVDVVAVVDRALQMVDHELRHRAQLVRRNPPEPTIIEGSAAWLEQIVVNLLINAMHALDGKSAHANRITLDIDAVDDHVTITVGDTGSGLPDPDRVFEPFFTTKPIGEGSGLGLSVCKQLVERMRGRIDVVTTSARGTKLAAVLPRRRHPAPIPRDVCEPAPRKERLRILVVDDEPLVLGALEALLAPEHDVDTADDGESALGKLAAVTHGDDDGDDYDVILCDLMMPRMNGRAVYEHIRARWPGRERRVVFITGGAFVPALASFLQSIDNLTLRKPFTVEQVLALVGEASRRTAIAATTTRP